MYGVHIVFVGRCEFQIFHPVVLSISINMVCVLIGGVGATKGFKNKAMYESFEGFPIDAQSNLHITLLSNLRRQDFTWKGTTPGCRPFYPSKIANFVLPG